MTTDYTDYNESLNDAVQAAHRQTRQAARDAARKLEEEIARVDRELAAVADELRTQTDQAAIMLLLDKQADLNLSKQKLPMMVSGARVLALRAETATLKPLSEEAFRRYELAEEAHAQAVAAVSELEAALVRARAHVKDTEAMRSQRLTEHNRVSNEYAECSLDAGRAERGEPLARPDRFDG